MPASSVTIDFGQVPDILQHSSENTVEALKEDPPTDKKGRLLTPKQIRARARRKMKRHEPMTDEELTHLYPQKPIEEWDLEELAHGRPKNSKGGFSGRAPKWITREMHEQAMEKYVAAVKQNMRGTTVSALSTLQDLLENEEVDEKGKPIVPPSTKVDISKFLIEHVVGKPTQRVESDVSVKLQGILGAVMVNPTDQGYQPAHYPGLTMKLADAKDYEDDDDILDAEVL